MTGYADSLAGRAPRAYTRPVKHTLVGLLVALVALTALPACKKAPDLTKAREQALALVAQYTPELKAMQGQIDALQGRLAALPKDTLGVDAVSAKLEAGRTKLTTLLALLAKVPAEATTAAQSGKATELRALIISTADAVAGGLTQVGNQVAEVEQSVVVLETKVKEQPLAVDGDAGVPTGAAGRPASDAGAATVDGAGPTADADAGAR